MFQTLKHRCLSGLRTCISLDVWHRICNVNLVIPYWHFVSDDEEVPHVHALGRRNVRRFNADLEFFLQHYSAITEQDLISYLDGGCVLPPRSVLLTFDDGFREIHDVVAPLLRAKGAPAIFFLISSAVDNQHLCYTQKKSLLTYKLERNHSAATLNEATRLLSLAGVSISPNIASRIRAVSYRQRYVLDDLARLFECDFQGYLSSHKPYMSSQQVKTLLRQGFAIGAHSVDHPLYTELSLGEQLTQTRESMRWLSERFHISCQSFAFPYRANGVSTDFFQTIFAEGELKVSFGTGGLVPHVFRRNLPRCTTERSDATASEALAHDFWHALIHWRAKSVFIRQRQQ
jgi:peptidoglycan/xylan/chitin deacetylase (PgdA/CDA1 family)